MTDECTADEAFINQIYAELNILNKFEDNQIVCSKPPADSFTIDDANIPSCSNTIPHPSSSHKYIHTKTSRNRNKQDRFQTCILCKREIRKLRDHFRSFHKLSEASRKYLLSFYRTQSVRGNVYECKDCNVRFCNKDRHAKAHQIIKVENPDSVEDLNKEILPSMLDVNYPSSNLSGVITDFFRRKRNTFKATNTDDESINKCLTKSKLLLLEKVCAVTEDLTKPDYLVSALSELKNLRSYKCTTMLNLLSFISDFVSYVNTYQSGLEEINEKCWKESIKKLRLIYSKSQKLEKSLSQKILFDKVPSKAIVKNLIEEISKLLSEQQLCFQSQKAFNYFVLQTRVNARSGPILKLTTDEFNEIEKRNVIKIDNCTCQLRIEDDQLVWIKNMLSDFKKEFHIDPIYVFGTAHNKIESGMATLVNSTIWKHFPNLRSYQFNSTSIRKMWEELNELKRPHFSEKEKFDSMAEREHGFSSDEEYLQYPKRTKNEMRIENQ